MIIADEDADDDDADADDQYTMPASANLSGALDIPRCKTAQDLDPLGDIAVGYVQEPHSIC